MNSYKIIGLMSGTSLDGLDIVFASYYATNEKEWSYKIHAATTIPYPSSLLKSLSESVHKSATELLILDKSLGLFYANAVNQFTIDYKIDTTSINAIASHGHTVYHQPENGFTHQIGCGEIIAYNTGLKVINDFRQKDVVAGGQGAPLVPIGDKLLFSSEAEAFLNIGGFANISFLKIDQSIAYDICPANLPLNHYAQLLKQPYDANGAIARSGIIQENKLNLLNDLAFYQKKAPKSLGTEWLHREFMPVLNEMNSPQNTLRTLVEHIAIQIASELNLQQKSSVFITGGGAKNTFLIERIQTHYNGVVRIPNVEIIDFKEALIFGFLGALYLHKTANILSSVTGAQRDTIGGVLHLPD